jgi:hypothetical protein
MAVTDPFSNTLQSPNTNLVQGVINRNINQTGGQSVLTPDELTVALTGTPAAVTPEINIPDSFSASQLTQDTTFDDVFAKRNQFAAELGQIESQALSLQNLLGQLGERPVGALKDPEAFLARTFAGDGRELTEAGQQQQNLLDRASKAVTSFFSGREEQIEGAQEQFDVTGRADLLAQTREQIAERRVRLREDLRAQEESAKLVARPFAEDERRAIVAEATEELADLAIIETAQLGNLEEARGLAQDLIDQKFKSFEGEIASIEAELARLQPTLDEEAGSRALQIQVALDERKRIIQEAKASEQEIKGFAIEAAQNGADTATIQRIMSAKTPQEALLHTAPFVGALERREQNLRIQKLQEEVKEIQEKNKIDVKSGAQNSAITALANISSGLEKNRREAVTAQMSTAVENLDEESVEIMLRNVAQQQAGKALTEQVIGRDAAVGALRDIQSGLEEFNQLGGDTSLLVGGSEAVARKLGETTDQRLASVATKIRLAIQTYRRAVSGAAFTESESAEYESIFPQIRNDHQLNLTIIGALTDMFEANNSSFYNNFYNATPSEIAEQAIIEELEALASDEQLAELNAEFNQ